MGIICGCHSHEGGNPATGYSQTGRSVEWIPACAGMTAVFGEIRPIHQQFLTTNRSNWDWFVQSIGFSIIGSIF